LTLAIFSDRMKIVLAQRTVVMRCHQTVARTLTGARLPAGLRGTFALADVSGS
jgi:hypothetical protein